MNKVESNNRLNQHDEDEYRKEATHFKTMQEEVHILHSDVCDTPLHSPNSEKETPKWFADRFLFY